MLAAQEQAISDLVGSLLIQVQPFSFPVSTSTGRVSLYVTHAVITGFEIL